MYNNRIMFIIVLLLCSTLASAQVNHYINITKAHLASNSPTASAYTYHNFSNGGAWYTSLRVQSLDQDFVHDSNPNFNFSVTDSKLIIYISNGRTSYGSTFVESNKLKDVFRNISLGNELLYINYGLPKTSGYPWKAGSYRTSIRVSPENSSSVLPNPNHTVYINVVKVAELSVDAWNTWTTTVNDLSQYESGLTGKSIARTLIHTVPAKITVKALDTKFTVVDLQNKPIDVDIPASVLSYDMDYTRIAMSTTDQTVFMAENIPDGNNTILPAENIFISSDNLKKYFNKPGTYSIQLSSIFWDAATNNRIKEYTHKLNIQVLDLSNLQLSTNQISLHMKTENDYLEGVSKDYSDHFTITHLSPYTITVKANGSSFTRSSGGTGIPVSSLQIGPASGQSTTGFNTVKLSTAPQELITATESAFGTKYGVKYSILAADSRKILDDALNNEMVSGTYTGVITYTLTPQ